LYADFFFLRFAFFFFQHKAFFFSPVSWSANLVFFNHRIFGAQISRALVNPEKWAAQSCQTAKDLDLVFNPPRKRNPWSNAQLVKTPLNSKKNRARHFAQLLSNFRLKNHEKKGVSKCLKTKIIFKKRACWFLPICIQRRV